MNCTYIAESCKLHQIRYIIHLNTINICILMAIYFLEVKHLCIRPFNLFLIVKHLILSKQKQRYQSSEQFSCAIPHYFPIFCVLVIWDVENQSVYLGNSGRLEVCCFPLLIYVLETDKKCFYLYPALFTLGQGWSLYLFTQVCRELMLLFTVFVYAARPYLDGWDSHLLHTQSPSRKGGGIREPHGGTAALVC